MVCDRVAYRLLPFGGVRSGAAHETAAAAEQADVIVNQNVCVLEVSEEDHSDGWLAALKGQRCRELQTRGDGACAMHATFGQGDPTRQDLCCLQPRLLLRSLLDQPLDMIRRKVRPSQMHLVDMVVSSLWTDFVVPYVDDVKRQRPHEEGLFLERLQSSSLWKCALERVKANTVLQQQIDDRKDTCRTLSASIFKPASERVFLGWLGNLSRSDAS